MHNSPMISKEWTNVNTNNNNSNNNIKSLISSFFYFIFDHKSNDCLIFIEEIDLCEVTHAASNNKYRNIFQFRFQLACILLCRSRLMTQIAPTRFSCVHVLLCVCVYPSSSSSTFSSFTHFDFDGFRGCNEKMSSLTFFFSSNFHFERAHSLENRTCVPVSVMCVLFSSSIIHRN